MYYIPSTYDFFPALNPPLSKNFPHKVCKSSICDGDCKLPRPAGQFQSDETLRQPTSDLSWQPLPRRSYSSHSFLEGNPAVHDVKLQNFW